MLISCCTQCFFNGFPCDTSCKKFFKINDYCVTDGFFVQVIVDCPFFMYAEEVSVDDNDS